ncbi:hypothetical protein ATB98_20905 [Sinorhizobium saheli]|uniref:Uncharacterized protein n=1 Tax=Sinorhizobium saheli TaxID=36856 RepID=A0A178YMK2_SINSA|nr:hypothetical protein ATB98_20905 [Sinorhizobium saheli]
MRRFLYMVCLDIGYIPHITGIFTIRVAAQLPLLGSLIESFAAILLRNARSIEIEVIIIAFTEP